MKHASIAEVQPVLANIYAKVLIIPHFFVYLQPYLGLFMKKGRFISVLLGIFMMLVSNTLRADDVISQFRIQIGRAHV